MATEEKQNNGLSAASEYVQIFMINVTIEKATNLKKADLMGKSDPYLRVTAFGQTYTTKTIMKTLDPVWNEKTTFVFFADPGKLHFEVWDWDKGTKDDSIGDCELSLNNFFNDGHNGFNGKLTLQNVKKGEIYVNVTCRKLVPSELEEKAKLLTKETEDQANKIETLNQNINDTTNNNNQLTTDNENLTKNIEDVKNSITEKEKDIAARETTKNELNEELDKTLLEKKKAQEKIDEAKNELKETEKELNKLKDELEKAKDYNDNLRVESENLEKQVNEQKRQEREEQERKNLKSKHKSEDSSAKLNSGSEDRIDVAPPASKCCVVL